MVNINGNLSLYYRPVVDLRDESVRIYRVVPVLRDEDGTILTDAKAVLPRDGDPMDIAARNIAVLQHAALALSKAHEAGNTVFLMVPISARALATKESSTTMVRALKGFPALCSSAMVAHIFDLPDKINMGTLDDIIVPLLVMLEKFVVEPPFGLDDYTDIGAINAQGVVLDLDPRQNDGAGPQMDLTNLWARAAPRRLNLFVQNAQEEETINAAMRFEGRGVDGPVIGDLLSAIGPRTTRSDLGALETTVL